MNTNNFNNEGKPIYFVNNGYMVWYDYAIIKLGTLFESLANIGLVRKFDCTIRLWVNTGALSVAVTNPNAANLTYSLTSANNTFTNTCPLVVGFYCKLFECRFHRWNTCYYTKYSSWSIH